MWAVCESKEIPLPSTTFTQIHVNKFQMSNTGSGIIQYDNSEI